MKDTLMQTIRRHAAHPPMKGPEQVFTGDVTVEMLFTLPEPSRLSAGLVTFQPGARSAWHTHPLGQALIVVSGAGWTQCEGGPKKEIRPGDVVACPCGKKHWHGATATSSMSHYALQEALDGKSVDWMEKVSDEDYLSEVMPD